MSFQETEITLNQLAAHNTRESLWIGVHRQVYDLTTFSAAHPGGIEVLVDCAGTDGSEAYDYAGHSELNTKKLQQYRVGPLADAASQTSHSPLSFPVERTKKKIRNAAFSQLQQLRVSRSSVKQAAALLTIPLLVALLASRLTQMEGLGMEDIGGSFWAGVAVASSASCVGSGYLYRIFLSTLDYQNDVFAFPPTVPRKRKVRS